MAEDVCIRIWTRATVPERFAHLARYADDGEVQNTMFVAHVPAEMLKDRTYRIANGESGTEGWLREGNSACLARTRSMCSPHPDGDGVLIVGSCV